MAAGMRDLLSLLLRRPSAHSIENTKGPYRLAAGQSSCTGAAAAIVSAGNVTAGQCNG